MPWYVVISHVHEEAVAERNIADQGYGVYLPKCLKLRRHANRTEVVTRPLFPRYLFAHVLDEQSCSPIFSTRGVKDLIRGMEGMPLAVPYREIQTLQERVGPAGVVDLTGRLPSPPDLAGKRVKGTLAGRDWEGVCDTNDATRARVLLEIMGRIVKIEVPLADVKPLDMAAE